MTDEQWLWVYANWALDNDEELEGMCPDCQEKAMEHNKCSRCGVTLSSASDKFVNPNFDPKRFEELSKED